MTAVVIIIGSKSLDMADRWRTAKEGGKLSIAREGLMAVRNYLSLARGHVITAKYTTL
jgi:hypothetical protein